MRFSEWASSPFVALTSTAPFGIHGLNERTTVRTTWDGMATTTVCASERTVGASLDASTPSGISISVR
jgi:hypothetical protein